jgi:hypothetical protein
MNADAGQRSASISVTVCPNGIGHAVRALRVLRTLEVSHGPFARLDVALSRAQLASLQPAIRAWLDARGVGIHHGIADPGVALPREPGTFDDGRLETWVDRWEASVVARADLVISDNLTGVLRARPDAVLMGSFLWSDVLEPFVSDRHVAAFVEEERRLLAASPPPMLATADVVHPGVVARTIAVPLPWFDDRPEPAHLPDEGEDPRVIAVIGGRTGAADELLRAVREALEASGRDVVTDPDALTGPRRASVSTVVCRPGLGTVTSCVVGSLPMLLVSEPGNPELEHTSEALEALGLARRLADPSAIVAEVTLMEEVDVRRTMRAALAARPTGGHRLAADWLAQRIAAPTDAGAAARPRPSDV